MGFDIHRESLSSIGVGVNMTQVDCHIRPEFRVFRMQYAVINELGIRRWSG